MTSSFAINRFKIYLNNPEKDLPEIRSMIAQHLDIPEDPREYIQLYSDNQAIENYFDPFKETTFKSFQEEYEQRRESLDINRKYINELKEGTNQEEHFQKLDEIQNNRGISCAQRTRLQRQEWETFAIKSQILFKYIQIANFEEKILDKKLADYRLKIYAV